MKKKLLLFLVIGTCFIIFVFTTILIVFRTGIGIPIERQLVNAAANDDLEKFKKYAARGVSLDAQEPRMLGQTPLIATTFIKGTNVFFYLLSAGAKVDAKDRDGETALMTAILSSGDANLLKIRALIAAGADVNARDKYGVSVLQYAKRASVGRPPTFSMTNTISLLEQHGATE